jgi:hypothetical protein
MLNGSVTFLGIDQHIPIGSNILVSAKLLGPTPNFNHAHKSSLNSACLLLHVENISHIFSVDEQGSRHWITTIQFVRGVLVDENNNLIGDKGLIDQKASDQSPEDDENYMNIISTPSK